MIQHHLTIIGAGHDPQPDLNDFQFVHIIYKIETVELDESNNIISWASTGLKVAELPTWNVDSKVSGTEVTKENLELWLAETVNLEELKADNVKNLQPK